MTARLSSCDEHPDYAAGCEECQARRRAYHHSRGCRTRHHGYFRRDGRTPEQAARAAAVSLAAKAVIAVCGEHRLAQMCEARMAEDGYETLARMLLGYEDLAVVQSLNTVPLLNSPSAST